ncbi:Fic family protein [Paenarthrobacter sp. NPDC058040]|uniref:Fic family protein n=1 Tax=unclassified Paenarthrobacter TaxID=2634190 RepID=UPI0036DAF09E
MNPQYQSTPVDADEAAAFVDGTTFATKHDVYQAEAEGISAVESEMLTAIADGTISAIDLCNYETLLEMHQACYSDVWKWAGKIRDRELSIGVAPEAIRQRLPEELGNIAYWIEHDVDPFWIAMAAHHRLVMIHPFVDGNGRITRLCADLLLYGLTSQYIFDWEPIVESKAYFEALRDADRTMNPDALLRVVEIIDLEGQ